MLIEDDISLGELIDRSISSYENILEAPTPNDDIIQSRILLSISDLVLCDSLISKLSIFSQNETLEDINTKDLKCLAVNGLRAMLIILLKTKGGGERKMNLTSAKSHFDSFTSQIENFEIIPPDQISQFKGPLSTLQDPARRRESKISQFKLEKRLKNDLEQLRKRQHSTRKSGVHSSTSHLLTQSADASSSRVLNQDDEDDDKERETYLTWLKLLYLKVHQELASIDLELDLLGQGAQMNDLPRHEKIQEEDYTWRLDKLNLGDNSPLISPSGKVLRPFTILPSQSTGSSSTTNRIRLRAEVFRPDWNLPTMTIDEYLDEQKAMGNILSGGGPTQAAQETQGERNQREAEEDNMTGEAKYEELRLKAVEWNEFTDSHRKGEGNMMNRG
ncbi:hypothetical protein O181_055681 [Austropuccinia psidii MF-1]|uniref:TAP42-like protein n=1 Tax=Austropuccinia psidii MF-1 TaxID=1389203 RepID=A0A9Q3HS95_9BASI|nr:hypothetical protein [Austropuccinia psidii MF-1]